MNKKNLKRNVTIALTSAVTLVGTFSGVHYLNHVNSLNTLKHKAIVMSKQYVENNNIAVDSSIKTGMSLLSEQGYASDFDSSCIKNSYVNVINNNGTYEYDPVINCSDDNSFYSTMVKTAAEQNSKVSTLGIIEGILTVDVIKSEENPTNQNVEVSIVAKEKISEVDGWTRSVDGKILTRVFTKNETLVVTIKSEANPAKQEIIKVVVSNIDKVAPTGVVSADITTPTNKDVILTLKTSKDVEITNAASSNVKKIDNRTFTVKMEQNGKFTFKFVDAAGNTGSAKYEVTNIDKVLPVITGINNGDHTNSDVTLEFDKGTGKLNGVNYVSGTTITKEGSYTLVVTDEAGNSATVSFVIDKSAPKVSNIKDGASYNTSVTPTFNEGNATLNGNDFASGTTITEDGDYTLIITDKAGNTTTVHFSIDATAPTGIVTADKVDATNQDVTLTLKTDEDVVITNATPNNINKVDDSTYTVVISQNQKFTFNFKDKAGNVGTASYDVKNIDKVAPIVTGVVNGKSYNVDVIPSFNEGTATLNGSDFTSGTTVKKDGDYTLIVTDEAGNKTTVKFVVDKTAPVITGVEDGKLYNVNVTPSFNEGTATLNGKDFTNGTEINAEGSYTLVVTDEAGNSATVKFEIDKTAPTGVVVASTTDLTNKTVILTLTTSENVINTNLASSNVKKVNDRTYTVEINENQKFTFKFKDKAGNTGKVSYTVSNIDKTAPVVEKVEYVPELSANKRSASDVTVIITYNEALKSAPAGWSFVSGSTTQITKTYTTTSGKDQRIVEQVAATDKAGNTSSLEKIEFVIDKTAPIVTGVVDGQSYNKKVTPVFNEGSATLNGNDFTSGTDVEIEGSYTLVVTDEVGNKTTVKFEIDKTAPVVEGVVDGESYNTDVTPTFNEGNATLNGNPYVSGTVVTNEGNYTLVVTDKAGNKTTVKFEIDKTAPVVSGVKDKDVYNTSVTPTFNEGNATLNGKDFTNGTVITEEGNYTLVVTDKAGNKTTVEFEIDTTAPVVEGVKDGEIYNTDVTPTFNEGNATLNGNPFVSGTEVSTEGNYTLVVTDKAGNKTTVKFEIDKTAPVVSGVADGESYNTDVTPTFNEGNATLNGNDFTSGTVVTDEGNYTLVVTDKAGNKTTVEFEIDKTAPVVSGVKHKHYYNVNVTPTFNEGNATLNGNPFVSGTEVSTEGNYTLVVTDKAGNTTKVKFVIDKTAPVVTGVENGKTYNVDVTPTFNEGNATLNGNDFTSGTVVTDEGNYTLVVTDKAGNKTTVKFEIDKTAPTVEGVVDGKIYNKNVTPTFTEGTATLNGNPFVSGTEVSIEGSYTLVVTDEVGNATTIHFEIDKTAPVVSGVADGESYNTDVTPTFNEGTAKLNGSDFTSGTVITTEGSYTLVVTDKAGNETTVKFEIDKTAPVIKGVENGHYYNKNVTPTFNEGTGKLNGNDFTSGTVVKKDKIYTLVVTDKAGNSTTVVFGIDKTAPVVEGVEDGRIYNTNVTPTFNEGTATLNGNPFVSGTEVTLEGSYTLVVTDRAGNVTTIKFEIDKTAPIVSGVEDGKIYNKNVTPTFNEGTATLNGKDFVSGKVVKGEKKHTLVVTDEAGNVTTIKFRIDKTAPIVSGVEDGKIYNKNVTPTFNEGSATLDGNDFVSGTVVATEGKHTLVVTDRAGNVTKVEFTVDKTAPIVTGVEHGHYYNVNVTPTFNEGTATLNGENFTSGTVITKDGKYTLIVTDAAGNVTKIKFVIDKTAPVVTGVENGEVYNVDVTIKFNEGSATLNGNNFESDTTVGFEGNYTLVVTDKAGNATTVKFGIDKTAPVISGVVDGKVYNVDVTPVFTEGSATLNGNDYTSGTAIADEGEYTLVVTDKAGNTTTVEFEIDKTAPIIEGVEHGHYYNTNVIPTFNEGTATLNGNSFESGTVVKTQKIYTLVVTDKAGNSTTVIFGIDKIAPIIEGVSDGESYNTDVTPTFNEGSAKLNGEDFVSGTTITAEGSYTLEVTDKANNTTKIKFVVDKTAPVVKGVKDGVYYNQDVIPTFNEGTAELNGSEFTSGKAITADGNYALIVTDAAGNKTTVNFAIDKTAPVIEGVEHGKYYDVDVTPTFNEGTATLNGKPYVSGTTITAEGSYVLEVTDAAGNKTTVRFGIDKLAPVITGVENGKIYNVDVTPTFNEGVATLNGNPYVNGTTITTDGEYTLEVIDVMGNKTTVTFTVDKTAPVITLNGANPQVIEYGNAYKELGATVKDNLDSTVKVVTDASGVNTSVIGTYQVTYKATDKAGNETIVTREVNVITATVSNLFRTENGCKANEDCYNTKAGNNYIWYSGYLWRVVKVNSDNTIKLVTEDSVAGFSYDDSSSTFTGSNASEWLNKNFYQSLNNAGNIVVTGNYCNELMTSLTKVRYTCNSSSVVKSKVGLLTIDEYNILGAEGGFLNNGDQFFTMTPTTAKSTWVVKSDGSKERGYYVTEPYALRPTITIAKTTAIGTGSGTSTDPYHLVNDTHGEAGTSLNTRKPGEYVSFANKTWRIVKSGPVTRLILDSYFKENGSYAQVQYGTVGTFNTKSGIGNYLNTTVYNSLFNAAEKKALVKAKWYYNTYALGQNPMNTTLTTSSKATDAYVGLIRIGDIMSGSSSTSRVDKFTSWTLNSSYENVWYTTWGGTNDYSKPTSIRGVKPVIELNSNVTISSGNGTSASPYTLNY